MSIKLMPDFGKASEISELSLVIKRIQDVVRELSTVWRQQISMRDFMHSDPDCAIECITNTMNQATLIPSLTVYNDGWFRFGIESPLLFDWNGFDVYKPNHVWYLDQVIRIIDTQMVIWITDSDHLVAKQMEKFSKALGVLQQYVDMHGFPIYYLKPKS